MKSCQITTSSKEHFNEVFTKLRSAGFVYSSYRCKTIEEIDSRWGYYPIITIGEDDVCKMVLHGPITIGEDDVCKMVLHGPSGTELPNTTVDEFLSSMKNLNEA